MPGDPEGSEAQIRRLRRRSVGPVHPARSSGSCSIGQLTGVRCQGRAGTDRGSWRKDRPNAPGNPWENGFIESFNARLRDELLDGDIFYTLVEVRIVIESWPVHYNTFRPRRSLGYKPPALEVFIPSSRDRVDAEAVNEPTS